MKDFIVETTDIQPLVGMSLKQIADVFSGLAQMYGEDAVLTVLKHKGGCPVVEVEVPIPTEAMNE